MRNTIFATGLAVAACVVAAAAHGNEIPMAWQVDSDLDTIEYQLESTPNFAEAIGEYTWSQVYWNTDVN